MIERIENVLALAAYIVLRHGPVYALEIARRSSPMDRAKRILETYALEGGRKTMRSSHSTLLTRSSHA